MKSAIPFTSLTRVNEWQVSGIAWRLIYVGAASLAIFLVFGNWAYDDPFITYRYAQNLASGMGLVYNPGERVLSTTTPLFALLLAALSGLPFDCFFDCAQNAAQGIPFDLAQLANLIGVVSLAAGGLCLWELGRAWKSPGAGWAGLLLYPIFPLLATTLGSETPLYLALCLGAFAAYANRRFLLVGALSALAVLTRPDGVLVPAVLGIHYLVSELKTGSLDIGIMPATSGKRKGHSSYLRRAIPWKAALIFFALTLPWILFAWGYYGSPIPATLITKQQQGSMLISQRFAVGFVSLAANYAKDWVYLIQAALALTGLAYAASRKRNWLILFSWTVAYFVAYSLLGVSRYFWYYAPLVPGYIAALGLGIQAIYAGVKAHTRIGSSAAPLTVALLLACLAVVQVDRSLDTAQYYDRRASAYRAVGEWLKANTPSGASVGALEVGIIGYYAERRIIDFAGLIQPAVARKLNAQSTYEDTALWAMKTYRPDFLVLHLGMFARLEAYAEGNCGQFQLFPGHIYGYSLDLQVYDCGNHQGRH